MLEVVKHMYILHVGSESGSQLFYSYVPLMYNLHAHISDVHSCVLAVNVAVY